EETSGDQVLARAAQRMGPVGGVIHLEGLSASLEPRELLALAARGQLEGAESLAPHVQPMLWAHRLARAQAQAAASGAGGMLLVATGEGGRMGLHGGGSLIGAALAGFAKALARERTGELVKCVDLDPADGARAMADALLAELRSGNATAEVGYQHGARHEVEL